MTGLASAPLDQTIGAAGTGTSPSSGFAANTTQADELLVGAITDEGDTASVAAFSAGTNGTANTCAASSTSSYASFAGVSSSYPPSLFGEYCAVSATGAYAAQGTFGSGTNPPWEALLATYKAAASTPTPTSTPTLGPGQTLLVQVALANVTVVASVAEPPAGFAPIAQLLISTPSTPPSLAPWEAPLRALFAVQITALDPNNQPIHLLQNPLHLSFRFTPSTPINPTLALVGAVDAESTDYPLSQIVANGDGSYTLTVELTRLSTVVVYAPAPSTLVRQYEFPLVSNRGPAPGW